MCRRITLSFLITSLVCMAAASPVSAELVGWWKMDDEGAGMAMDSSGNNRHGTFRGDAYLTAGLVGEAVALDGAGDYVEIVGWTGILGTASRSVTAWVKTSLTGTGAIVGWGPNGSGTRMGFRINDSRLRFEHHAGNIQGNTPLTDGEWHHVAVTIAESAAVNNNDIKLWLDGKEDQQTVNDPDAVNTTSGANVRIGSRPSQNDRFFNGLIDDVRIFDRELTQAEIQETMVIRVAHDPTPADGAESASTTVALSWQPGADATEYQIYFSEDRNAVATGAAEADKGIKTGTSHLEFGLTFGSTYYWRVDAINDANPDSPWTGTVWSFTIPSLKATEPDPVAGKINVPTDIQLNWTEGYGMIIQDVYLGTSFDDVNNADTSTADIFQESTANTNYSLTGLEYDTTYYWRIDTSRLEGADLLVAKGDVWSFTTMPYIPPSSDPNLVAQWTFEELAGDTVLDRAGRGNHAYLRGNATFETPGYMGDGAMISDGDAGNSYAAISNLSYASTGMPAVSVAAWVRTEGTDGTMCIVSFDRNEYWRFEIGGNNGGMGPGRLGFETMTDAGQLDFGGNALVNDGNWHHVAAVYDNGTVNLYVDGWLDATTSMGTGFGSGNTRYGFIGSRSEATYFDHTDYGGHNEKWAGSLDDVRIYDKGLTRDDVLLVMRGDPLQAWNPVPTNWRTVTVDQFSVLSWSPGDMAARHDLYFGTNEDAVRNASIGDPMGVYIGRQDPNSYIPTGMALGQTYYWRVDEYNTDGSLTTGRIWSFTLGAFLLIDDFEDYGDLQLPNEPGGRIWYTWLDGFGYNNPPPAYPGNGTGSVVNPTSAANSGSQAMFVQYDNTGTFENSLGVHYSMVNANPANLSLGTNWNRNGTAALSLWFRGEPSPAGSLVNETDGSTTISGGGADIWNVTYAGQSGEPYHDEFNFAYVETNVNTFTSAIVKINSVAFTNTWAKVGIMVRQSLDDDSAHSSVVATPGQGVSFQRRTDTGVASASTTVAGITTPVWLKLERSAGGNTNVYYSTDGTATWEQIDGVNVFMSDTIYVGIAVTSHDRSQICKANFSDFTINGSPVTNLQTQAIGGNEPEPLFVKLSDGINEATVTHPDPDAILNTTWQEWNIPLADFAGVNLSNVQDVAVGVGTIGGPAGGTGRLYVDDMRVYAPRCVPDLAKPAASFNNDCVVNEADLAILVADWLASGYEVTVETASDANLEASYQFENSLLDSSGNSRHADANGVITYVTGVSGMAMETDGTTWAEVPDFNGVTGASDRTMAVWVKSDDADDADFVSWGQDVPTQKWVFRQQSNNGLPGTIRCEVNGGFICGSTDIRDGEWHHAAAVFTNDGTPMLEDVDLYVDGALERISALNNNAVNTVETGHVVIANEPWNTGRPMVGALDDLRIYSRSLSQGEILNLAGLTAGSVFQQPVAALISTAEDIDLNDDEAVDFKDIAVMLDSWLDEVLWP